MLKTIFKIINFIILISIIIAAYSFFIEPKLLVSKTNEFHISNLQEELTVVQFSDTHLGDNYSLDSLSKLVNKINNKKPDIIVFTGDLIDKTNTYNKIDQIPEILSKLEARLGKFAIYGNHDIGAGGIKYYEQIMTDSNFILLKNNSFLLKINDNENINIIGLDDVSLGNPNYSIATNLASIESTNILLTHAPDAIDNMDLSQIQIIFAGHSHGGQVNIPILKNEVLPTYAKKYINGLYNITDVSSLYVSSGIGTTRIPIRFLIPPEFIVHKIR